MRNLDLKFLLLQHFPSQNEAAERLGFSKVRLSRLVHRHAKPTDKDLGKLSKLVSKDRARELLGMN